MTHIRPLGQGEVLKPWGPGAGEVIITVDPRAAGASFGSGTRTLLRGESIPAQRHLRSDQVWFVHKGQGRAVVETETMTVVPGSVVSIPKGAWHGLRNTGTGVLQVVWTVAPPGLEEFYRELARRGGVADASGLREVAARYGIEFRSNAESAAVVPSRVEGRRRRRRGGRGRGPSIRATQEQAQLQPGVTARPAPQPAPGPGARHRRRRPASSGQVPRSGSGQAPPAPKGRRPREGGRHRFGHAKEVYMGGRWIRVSGEGPVIAPGRERSRGPQEGVTKDDTPPGPLSVPL